MLGTIWHSGFSLWLRWHCKQDLQFGLKMLQLHGCSSYQNGRRFRALAWDKSLISWLLPVYGTKWRKRTTFFTNTAPGGFRTLCTGCQKHQFFQGRSKKHKMSWTLVVQAYPAGVARVVVRALAMKARLAEEERTFDPASCAKAGTMRIGEASRSGPRRPWGELRSGLLADVPLVEARAIEIQDRVWEAFSEWMRKSLSSGAVSSAMAQPALLVYLARKYGNHLYSSGKSLFVFRHLLVFLQQNFAMAKPYMSIYIFICWSMVSRWEMMESTVHRAHCLFRFSKRWLE